MTVPTEIRRICAETPKMINIIAFFSSIRTTLDQTARKENKNLYTQGQDNAKHIMDVSSNNYHTTYEK